MTQLLATRNGHGQSGWSPIGCDGFYFHAMYKKYGIGKWVVHIGCECFRTNLNIPCPLPTTFSFPLILLVIQLLICII